MPYIGKEPARVPVTAADIPDDSITTAKILDSAITISDIGDDQVTVAKLANAINTDIATGVTANTTANAALPKAGGAMTGAITTNSTFDGVDIATRDGVLTSTTTTAQAALPKAGGTMTGALTVNAAAVFNESGGDVDFRVESDGNANMLFVDGGNNRVGLGTGSPATQLQLINTGESMIRMGYSTTQYGQVGRNSDGTYEFSCYENGGVLKFGTSTTNGATTERMRIDSSGNVGIGETSPLGKLHVKTADSGASADASADELVIEGSGNTGMSILSGASSSGSIYFGDSGTNYDGYIAYSQTDRKLTFGTAAGGRMSIDSSGNVGIGVTPETWTGNVALQIGGTGALGCPSSTSAGQWLEISQNHYYNSGAKRISQDEASSYLQTAGKHIFRVVASGNADAAITWVDGMTINNSGYVDMAGASDVRLTLGSQGTAGNNDANWIRGNGTSISYNAASANHIWETGGSEKMRIDSSGRVAIGTSDIENSNTSLTIDVNQSSNNARGLHFYGGADVTDKYISIGRTHTAGNYYINSEVRFGAEVGGAGSSFLSFATGTNNPNEQTGTAERMRIDSSGNVGIGKTPTDKPLELYSTGNTALRIQNSTTGSGSGDGLLIETSISNSDALIWNYESAALKFGTAGTERMRIDSSGNVDIKTGGANLKLAYTSSDIHSANLGWRHLQLGNNGGNYIIGGNTSTGGKLMFVVNNTTDLSTDNGSSHNGILAMTIESDGKVGIGCTPIRALDIKATGDPGIRLESASQSADVITLRNGDGRVGLARDAITVTTSNKVLIGRTSAHSTEHLQISHAGASTYGLYLNSTSGGSGTHYHMSIARGDTQCGYMTSGATTVNLNNTSDERLKENIQDSASAIQDLKDMKVRQFDWKNDRDVHRDYGFVAQELVTVVPEAVNQGSAELKADGTPVQSWGVDDSKIIPRMVKAMQEQQVTIEALTARITTLENA